MRRSVILSLCVVLAVAAGAQAATMFGTGDLADGDFTYTRTSVVVPLGGAMTGSSVTLDRIDISYASAPTAVPGAKLQALTGTYAALDGDHLNSYIWTYPDTWRDYTTNYVFSLGTDSNPVHALSYVNFESWSSSATWAPNPMSADNSYLFEKEEWVWNDKMGDWEFLGYSSCAKYYTDVTGGWYTDVEANKLEAGTGLLAQLYVDSGADVSISGTWNFGGTTLNGSISTVPEPSTLALISMGLVGLLCYAWRKTH